MNEAPETPKKQFTPEDLNRVFQALSASKASCVLMGGQASNFWARRFASVDPTLTAIRDHYGFTSQDVDFVGDRKAAAVLAESLQTSLKPISKHEAFGSLLTGAGHYGPATKRSRTQP